MIADTILGDIDAKITRAAQDRAIAQEAETGLYRRMERLGRIVELTNAEIDAHLADRTALTTPGDPAKIAAAWAGVEHTTPPDYLQALKALRFLMDTTPALPDQGPIIEYPGIVQDEHGCYVADLDDPIYTRYPSIRLGCAEVW